MFASPIKLFLKFDCSNSIFARLVLTSRSLCRNLVELHCEHVVNSTGKVKVGGLEKEYTLGSGFGRIERMGSSF